MTEKSSPKPLLGYMDNETVMLDFDETSFKTVKHWTSKKVDKFKLGVFIRLKSSEQCYHVVFNRKVLLTEKMHIVAGFHYYRSA